MSYAKYHCFGFKPKDENNYPDWYNNSHSNSVVQSKKKKKTLFTRGYQESRERLAKNSYYSRSCFNCADYYQASGDKEEMCQNPEVLQYDMVVTDNNIYCLKWRPSSSVMTEQQSLFKRSGRSRLD